MKEIWIMCADSESGDHYHACASWDHEPTEDEINRIKITIDCIVLGDEDKEDVDFVVDGVPYLNLLYETISKISV